MALQLEPGTQYPLRPASVAGNADGDFEAGTEGSYPPTYAAAGFDVLAGGVSWGSGGIADEWDKIKSQAAALYLAPGIWEVQIMGTVNNTSANRESFIVWIANSDNTTRFAESPQFTVLGNEGTSVYLRGIVHVSKSSTLSTTVPGTAEIKIGMAQVSNNFGDANFTIPDGGRIVIVRRIGNADEAGPADNANSSSTY